MKQIGLITCWFISISPFAFSAAPTWEEHGKLEVSANRHGIQHEDGTPFLWIGDTAWGMFQQLKREEVDLYLVSALRGLNDPEQPGQESWGGQFVRPDPTKNHWYDGPGPESVYKWRAEVQEDFARRADWMLP